MKLDKLHNPFSISNCPGYIYIPIVEQTAHEDLASENAKRATVSTAVACSMQLSKQLPRSFISCRLSGLCDLLRISSRARLVSEVI